MDSVAAALQAVRLQNWLSIIAALSAIAIPAIVIWLLLRWTAATRWWQTLAIWIAGAATILLYVAAAFVFAVCWGGEIGESGKSRLARAYGDRIVAGLEQYHRVRNAYPKSLAELVPRYISRADLDAPRESVLRYPFEYRADSDTYSLLVRYVGPGMNECRYAPAQVWHCGGYF